MLGRADRARAEADAAVVEDRHRDLETLAGLAEHVLGRDLDVVEVQAAQVVAAQAHRVEALADLEPPHALLQDQRDVAVLAVDLAAGEGGEHVALRAVADVALLAVENVGAVGLADRARLELVGVGAGLRLSQREAGELAPAREVGQEALLLLVAAEHVDALEADRLVDAEHDRERRVDLGEGLEDPRVAGLGEALPAVGLVDVQAAEPRLAELADRPVADPARLLDLRCDPCATRSRARPRSAQRIRSCSAGSGCGHGNTISSWISPRNSDLVNDETAPSGLSSI